MKNTASVDDSKVYSMIGSFFEGLHQKNKKTLPDNAILSVSFTRSLHMTRCNQDTLVHAVNDSGRQHGPVGKGGERAKLRRLKRGDEENRGIIISR